MVKSFLPYHGFDLTLSFIERLLCAVCRKFETSHEGIFHVPGLLAQLTRGELVILLITQRLNNIKLQ